MMCILPFFCAEFVLGLVGDFGLTRSCKHARVCPVPVHVAFRMCPFSAISLIHLSLCVSPLFPSLCLFVFFLFCSLQNADKLYKGQLSEFTPLSSIHTPPIHKRGGDEDQSHTHRRSESSPRKKIMYTHWGGGPDYCTFRPFLRFGNPRLSGMAYAYAAPGRETSI